MAMIDGFLSGLADSPAVKEAMNQFIELRDGVIQAMTHFNSRFDSLEQQNKIMDAKLDKIIFEREHPSNFAPCSDDGLLKLLSSEGQEMRIQEVQPIPVMNVAHESEV